MVDPRHRQELAHVLLTELLAYQFAMPVRWAETQTVLFENCKIQRLIEFCPTPILLGMAKKTLDQFNAESDAANGFKRTLLDINADYDTICYEKLIPDGVSMTGSVPKDQLKPDMTIAATPASNLVPVTPAPVVAGIKESSPDAPVSALESLIGLVSSGLRKPASAISLRESIKTLTGGKSTVQNEIVGDLIEEFGSVPDDVENLSLEELASIIQKSYDGKLQKCLRTRLEKMAASKMPASFGLSAMRSTLQNKWGLGPGRQDAVLLCTLGEQQQLTSRLRETADAVAFLDRIAEAYVESAGLTRPTGRELPEDQQQPGIDSKLMQQLRSEQTLLKQKIASLLYVQDYDDGEAQVASSNSDFGNLEDRKKLDMFESELGDDFCYGIRPIFKAQHQRVYKSVWNWAHIDLLILFYRCIAALNAKCVPTREDLAAIKRVVKERWSPRLENVRKFLLHQTSLRSDRTIYALREALGAPHIAAFEPHNKDELHECAVKYPDVNDITDVNSTLWRHGTTSHPMNFLAGTSTGGERTTPHKRRVKTSLLILRRQGASWVTHNDLTIRMNRNDAPITANALSGKNILLTGAGPGSIGIALLPSLLRGGAKVVVATSRAMADAGPIYQKIFASHGNHGSQLIVLPCNQGSKVDVENLITHIYDTVHGLGWDLDIILPLAAIPEKGREIDNIDSKSELAHRAMLVNTLRALGAVKLAKEAKAFHTRPAQVLLPLSPNMGTFGNDGLYSESKMGLVAALNKWHSESWSGYLSLYGVFIGWTRGTGLMSDNDLMAQRVEDLGFKVFSAEEMANNLLRLMNTPFVSACQAESLIADFSGGMDSDPALASFLVKARMEMQQKQDVERALLNEEALSANTSQVKHGPPVQPAASLVDLELGFPKLPDYATEVHPLNSKLDGMVDLKSVVVVVGFAEIGPWGNARTRWEMEMNGELSAQACIELAWMTGMIKHNPVEQMSPADMSSFEWIDTADGSPVKDTEVKAKYEKRILAHTGLRLINPSPLDHSNRDKKQVLQEIMLKDDLPLFATYREKAMDFVREHGDLAHIRQIPGSDEWSVQLKKGAIIMVPAATTYDRIVGGQIPTGWDPTVYGIPRDFCETVDRCTLMALVCAAETFLSAGISDVYELFKTIHLSDLANCVGSGMGGGRSLQKLYRERYLDKDVQNDILAETFINTTGAWLNMLLMGSAGPTRTPVGACATALESLNQGYDLIASGTAKACLVGGFDDMTQDTSAEFAAMNATNNSAADLERGRAPSETSRPCSSSRAGFIESEGCGMQLLTNAEIALKLGLPIRSIVAHVQTASDGIGKSVPAPGKGIMVNVRESTSPASGGSVPSLDIGFRKMQLAHALKSIRDRRDLVQQHTISDIAAEEDEYAITEGREEQEARRRFGNAFWAHDRRISPLRGALSVWGLSADDIGVLSLHGTSTELNEKNEVEVLHRQLDQLGRTPGNAALAVCQKYLTGHPKGAAAAWMLNGCCQILDTGIVPGNRNADDIDLELEKWENVVFPDRTIAVGEIKAFSVTSFGFGQKGAQALGIHPKFLFATVDEERFVEYTRVRQKRYWRAKQTFQNAFYSGQMVKLKDHPPFDKSLQIECLVDASCRVP